MASNALRPLGRLSTMLSLAILGGCMTTTAIVGTDAGCTVLPPITWSVRDTEPTVKGVKKHNAAWRALCLANGGKDR